MSDQGVSSIFLTTGATEDRKERKFALESRFGPKWEDGNVLQWQWMDLHANSSAWTYASGLPSGNLKHTLMVSQSWISSSAGRRTDPRYSICTYIRMRKIYDPLALPLLVPQIGWYSSVEYEKILVHLQCLVLPLANYGQANFQTFVKLPDGSSSWIFLPPYIWFCSPSSTYLPKTILGCL